MNKLIQIIFVLLTATFLVSCNDSGKGKSSKAELVSEYKELSAELDFLGAPQINWSQEQVLNVQKKWQRLKDVRDLLKNESGPEVANIMVDNFNHKYSLAREVTNKVLISQQNIITEASERLFSNPPADQLLFVPGRTSNAVKPREASDFSNLLVARLEERKKNNINGWTFVKAIKSAKSPGEIWDEPTLVAYIDIIKLAMETLEETNDYLEKQGNSQSSDPLKVGLLLEHELTEEEKKENERERSMAKIFIKRHDEDLVLFEEWLAKAETILEEKKKESTSTDESQQMSVIPSELAELLIMYNFLPHLEYLNSIDNETSPADGWSVEKLKVNQEAITVLTPVYESQLHFVEGLEDRLRPEFFSLKQNGFSKAAEFARRRLSEIEGVLSHIEFFEGSVGSEPAESVEESAPVLQPTEVVEEQAPEVTPAEVIEEQAPEVTPAEVIEEQAPEVMPAEVIEEQAPEVTPAEVVEEQVPEVIPAEAVGEEALPATRDKLGDTSENKLVASFQKLKKEFDDLAVKINSVNPDSIDTFDYLVTRAQVLYDNALSISAEEGSPVEKVTNDLNEMKAVLEGWDNTKK